jgi:hypothetical protein
LATANSTSFELLKVYKSIGILKVLFSYIKSIKYSGHPFIFTDGMRETSPTNKLLLPVLIKSSTTTTFCPFASPLLGFGAVF